METSKLSGTALDWAVAKAEGMHVTMVRGGWFVFDSDAYSEFRNDYNDDKLQSFKPSTNWAQGGVIIEREKIDTYYGEKGWWQAVAETNDVFAFGSTPLEAAMRCYVTSKLGKEIELHEDLNGQA